VILTTTTDYGTNYSHPVLISSWVVAGIEFRYTDEKPDLIEIEVGNWPDQFYRLHDDCGNQITITYDDDVNENPLVVAIDPRLTLGWSFVRFRSAVATGQLDITLRLARV
jgi:hypothetical protein